MAINGALPGPQLSIIAGVHGDEFENCEAVRRLYASVDPAILRGSIVATPQANPGAFEVQSRHNGVDHLDLNRQFPGNPDGFLTQRTAAALVETFVDGADFLLDMHSGGMVLDLAPFVGFDVTPGATGEESFRLAKATGIRTLYGSTPFASVLRLVAAERGVPSILVEIGSQGVLVNELVDMSVDVLHRVMTSVEMLPADAAATPPDNFVILEAHPSGEFMHANTGGFLTHTINLGDIVRQGDVLGVVTDPFGNVLETISAPHEGLVAEMRAVPVLHTGDWTYAVIPVIAEVPYDSSLSTIEEMRKK
ncbi:N-alpha-acetyl-L-2,4-diaminobutyric acid deacetylase [compost metagenome]